MFKKSWQLTIFIILISLSAIVQFSLISAWSGLLGQINLGLLTLIFALFFFSFRITIFLVLLFGFWFDLMTFKFFGFYTISLFATAFLGYWILKNWLTNRSLYSFLALIFIATTFYNFFSALLLYFTAAEKSWFFIGQVDFWLALVYQLSWNLLAAILLFHLATSLIKKLNPFFLEKKTIL